MVRHFATDGIDLAFMVGYGARDVDGNYERAEIWASPFSTDPASLAPRFVTTKAGRRTYAQIAVASGRVAFLDHGPDGQLTSLVIVRLRDGLRVDVPARTGRARGGRTCVCRVRAVASA